MVFLRADQEISRLGNPPALLEDSRSLTAPGVVAESVLGEPLKVYERKDDATVRKSETHELGMQISCGVHPEMPPEGGVRATQSGLGARVPQFGGTEGMQGGGGGT